MRFDANVSVRPKGSGELGTRTEVKNVNSLRSLQRAVAFEIERQISVRSSGGDVVLETRHWHEGTGKTTSMRKKEESEDYRYFQEPDLLPLYIDGPWRDRVHEALPELPAAVRARYEASGTDARTAILLVDAPDLALLFDEAVSAGADARTVGLWLTGEVVAILRQHDQKIEDASLEADHLVELAGMVDGGELSATAAKEVLAGVVAGEGSAREVAAHRDLMQLTDTSAIEVAVEEAIAANPDAFAKLSGGDMKPIGFLVGQVMRATGGRADPKLVQSLLREKSSGT